MGRILQLGKTFSGLLFTAVAAAIGLTLIYLPGWVIDKYQVVASLGAFWGYLYLAVVIAGTVLFLGSLLWTVWRLWGASRLKQLERNRRSKNPSQLSYGQKQSEIAENIQRLQDLRSRSADNPQLQAELDPLLADVQHKRELQTLEIVAFGTISSGKSSVLNLLAGRDIFATDVRGGTTVSRNEIPWAGIDKVTLVDTPGLGEVDGERHVWIAADSAKDADIVLLVVDGPLRDSEHKLLEKLGQMEKRVVICLNKSDWYQTEDREKLFGQIVSQTKQWVQPDEIIAIQAQPGTRIRRKVKGDGTTEDEQVVVPADIGELADCMMAIVRQDGKELVLANLLLQSRGMLEKAKDRVKAAIDRKAWDTVDKYMWGAAGVAAVNPFPFVDLAAGIGISTKMIMDLADIYDQKMDVQTASKWLTEMGKVLISVLGVQGASLAVASVVSSLIKTVPIAGTLVGNAMQGVVQALITRWIGAVFIDYFSNEMQFEDGGLANVARRQWERVTATDEIKKLVVQARQKLIG